MVVIHSKTIMIVVSNQGVKRCKKEVIYEACTEGRNFVSFEVMHDLTTV